MEKISKIKWYLKELEEGRARPVGDGEIWVSWVKGYLGRLEEGAIGDRYLLERAELVSS